MKFIKSNFSIEELEAFRNQEGYIDLEQAGIVLDEASREIRGNSERFKNWVDFNETKVLIKEETVLETLLYNNQEDNIYKEQLETLLEKGKDEIRDAVETNMSIKATVYNLRNLNVDEQKMDKYDVFYRDLLIGRLLVKGKQHKYEVEKTSIERLEGKVPIDPVLLETRDWGEPIPFFKTRLQNASRFDNQEIGYQTDNYKILKVS